MARFPASTLTYEVLGRARDRYSALQSRLDSSRAYSAAWEAHRPMLARLGEAEATYALPFLARLQLADPSSWELIDDREAAYPRASMMEALSALLAEFEAVHGGSSYFLPILKGVMSYIDGFEQEAFDAFAKVGGETSFYEVVKDDFSGAACARRLVSPRGLRAFRDQAGFEPIKIYHQSARIDPSLVSIAADGLYYRAFTPSWLPVLEALRVHRIGGHFHLMARNEGELALLDETIRWCKARDVSCVLTYEVVQPADRAYFTIRRFFAAQVVMAATSASLLALDADLKVSDPGRIAGIFSRHEGVGVSIASGPWHGYLPWRRISGGAVLLPACDATRTYLGLVTDYIEYFWLANDNRHWWVDQLALECARLTAVKQWPAIFFRDFSREIWEIFPASEAYKVEQLNLLPEVGDATANGVHWHTRLRQLQLGS